MRFRNVKEHPDVILSGHIAYTEFKGALTENAILQSLITQFDAEPYYWSSENRAEVDFLLQTKLGIVPIEVKSEARISGKSLSVYTKKYEPKLRIRYSTNNLKINDGLLSIPIYLADWTSVLIDKVALKL